MGTSGVVSSNTTPTGPLVLSRAADVSGDFRRILYANSGLYGSSGYGADGGGGEGYVGGDTAVSETTSFGGGEVSFFRSSNLGEWSVELEVTSLLVALVCGTWETFYQPRVEAGSRRGGSATRYCLWAVLRSPWRCSVLQFSGVVVCDF